MCTIAERELNKVSMLLDSNLTCVTLVAAELKLNFSQSSYLNEPDLRRHHEVAYRRGDVTDTQQTFNRRRKATTADEQQADPRHKVGRTSDSEGVSVACQNHAP
jgi:hypothetical protein